MTNCSLELYQPINILKPIDDNIWMVDGPIIHMDFVLGAKVPFSTRMMVVKMPDGGLWLHSPIAPDEELFAQIDALGEPTSIIAPNSIHYWYVPDWVERYPNAKVYAVPGLGDTAKRPLPIDETLSDGDTDDWYGIFDLLVFPGSVVTEAVFHHRPSKTVILCDLIENFEPRRVQSWWLRQMLKLAGAADPDGKAPIDLRMTFWKYRKIFAEKAKQMIAWNADIVIMAHGRPYLENGTKELRRAFRWVKGIE